MGRVLAVKRIIVHVYVDDVIKSNTSHAIYGSLNESDPYGCLCLNTWYPSSWKCLIVMGRYGLKKKVCHRGIWWDLRFYKPLASSLGLSVCVCGFKM